MEILQRDKSLACKVGNIEPLWYSKSHIVIDRQTRFVIVRKEGHEVGNDKTHKGRNTPEDIHIQRG